MLIRFRWLSIAGRQCGSDSVHTDSQFAVHTTPDLTLMPIRELHQLADKPSESQRTWKKRGLFIWSPSPILIPPIICEGSEPSPIHRQLSSANREGLFFDKVQGNFASALIDSPAICTETFHARARIRACVRTRTILIGSEQKSGWKLVSPFSTYRRYYHNRTVSSTRRSKSNRAILSWKNNKFLLYSIFIFISFYIFHQLL